MSKRRKRTRGHPAKPPAPQPKQQPKQRISRPAAAEHSSPRILVYALLAVALFAGLYLHAYALPQLTHFASGLSMPETRITGYDAAEISTLRQALQQEAAGQLNYLHRTAGALFPVFVFLATWAVFGLLVRRRWRWAVVAGAAVFAVVDITENVLIDRMLAQEPLDAGLVGLASTMTTLSWVLLAVIAAAIIVVVVRDLVVTKPRPDPADS